jgi:hypothetical protein
MNVAETLRPILQHEAEQIVLAARENLLHSEGGDDRFPWLQRRAIAKNVVASVSDMGIGVSASGANAQVMELGGVDRPPSPFLRPALAARLGPFTQSLGAAISQAIADRLARRR